MVNIRTIAQHFRKPLKHDELFRIVYRGLTPDYRRYLSNFDIHSVKELERILRRYEKIKEIDKRYLPPPVKDKMKFPMAAPKQSTRVSKIDAILESSTSESSPEPSVSQNRMKKENKAKNSEREVGRKFSLEDLAALINNSQRFSATREQTDPIKPPTTNAPATSYARVVSRNVTVVREARIRLKKIAVDHSVRIIYRKSDHKMISDHLLVCVIRVGQVGIKRFSALVKCVIVVVGWVIIHLNVQINQPRNKNNVRSVERGEPFSLAVQVVCQFAKCWET